MRRELSFEGPPGAVPAAAEDLVRALVRSRPLIPVARLHTDRTPIEVRDETGRTLAEIVDDHVTVYRDKHNTDEFREVEVEVFAAGRVGDRLLSAATDRLVAAGCRRRPAHPQAGSGARPPRPRGARTHGSTRRPRHLTREPGPPRHRPMRQPSPAPRPRRSTRRRPRGRPPVPGRRPPVTIRLAHLRPAPRARPARRAARRTALARGRRGRRARQRRARRAAPDPGRAIFPNQTPRASRR